MIVDVVFNLPLERSFHYLVPTALEAQVRPGVRVAAPFGPRERIGFITQEVARSDVPQLKPIRRVLDPLPVIDGERWALAEWLAAYYYCSLGEALSAMVPSALRIKPGPAEPAAAAQGAQAPALTLSPSQAASLAVILKAAEEASHRVVLLHGVTGSGKTELYLQAIAHMLTEGRSAICLIPEIALTPQTIDRFRARFGAQVAVWHSRLTARQRNAEWVRVASGACRVVVGARSAVFAPVQRLGLVILDEEHEPTYKQADAPRYHAREVALERARLSGAAVVLGSATPAIESMQAALEGRFRLAELPDRVRGRRLPKVQVIDMRDELGARRHAGPLSFQLQEALRQTVERGEQAMLLLNRRGFARSAQCPVCGEVVRCGHCTVPMVYHASRNELLCHYCNLHQPVPELCAVCQKGSLRMRGTGTERLESELHRAFPGAAIARMDTDTMKGRGRHEEVYEAMKARQIGLLVGTQMIAKGLDFPEVTLVGVVSADTALNLPDFRAGERTFDLLTQVAGRAGRGDQPGRVLIQTFCPRHYAVALAAKQDYAGFFQEEIAMRKRLTLPPFAHLIELTVQGSARQRVQEAAERLTAQLGPGAKRAGVELLGPVPHRVPRVRKTYRVCLVLKGAEVPPMVGLLRGVLQAGRKFAGLPVTVDVDPL